MSYKYIGFPESQELMEYDDFMDHAVSANEPGAYLVDSDWLDSLDDDSEE